MKKLLVVDDYADLHDLIAMIFEDDSIQIKSSLTATHVFEDIESFQPDLILLDIRIGAVDGRDLCNRIKSSLLYNHIPVVLMSALNVDITNIGADAYFEKPFEVEVVRNLVLDLIHKDSETSLLIH